MKCSKCGCEFEGNFCPNCGTVANKAARCPICGKERAQNDRFCSGCGYEYDKAAQQATKPAASQTAAEATAGPAAAIKKERQPLSAKNKKIIIISSVLSAVLIIAVIAIVLVVNSLSNIFRVGKVSQIDLGDSKSQVVAVLGEPDEYDETTYTYYSDNYNNILKKIYSIETEDIDDWDDLVEAAERVAELYEKLIALEYQRIDVIFSDGAVTAVYFDASCCDSTASDKTLESVTVLSGSFTQYTTDTTTQITYIAEFTDGSYAKATATASRDSSEIITTTSSNIEITWGDKLYSEYSNNISVTEANYGYYLEEGTLTVSLNDAALSNLTTREKNSITTVVISDSVTEIANSAFSGFKSLTSVTIGNSVTSISERAFYDCTSLTSITIPDSVTSIGYCAFYNCTSLTSVIIGDSVTSIGIYAFYNCTSLTSINILDSVTSIGYCAFYNCTSLTSVTIGDSVTSIGSFAFYNCTSLTSVTFENTSGWHRTKASGASNGTSISSKTIANASTIAKYLRSTYNDYYWYRSES